MNLAKQAITRSEAITYAIDTTKAWGYPVVSVNDVLGPYDEGGTPAFSVSVTASNDEEKTRGCWTVWKQPNGAVYGEW